MLKQVKKYRIILALALSLPAADYFVFPLAEQRAREDLHRFIEIIDSIDFNFELDEEVNRVRCNAKNKYARLYFLYSYRACIWKSTTVISNAADYSLYFDVKPPRRIISLGRLLVNQARYLDNSIGQFRLAEPLNDGTIIFSSSISDLDKNAIIEALSMRGVENVRER